jgi:5-methyltetrahydropteroyltriglutamate--homocysteine methyltransferase
MTQGTPVLTVIGSYPVQINRLQIMDTYFQKLSLPSWKPFIKQAVEQMVESGVRLVSDGQTRDPFMTIFTRGFNGCQVRERTEVIEPIRFSQPVTLSDLEYVRLIIPDDTLLIGLLVGPYTLSQSVVDHVYLDEKELAFAFAEALKKEAEHIQPVVDMISVDEPFFANIFPEYAYELIDTVLTNISCPTRLHACGDVSGIVSSLLDLPVDVLSHEFTATPSLFDSFAEYPNEKKQICLGSVRSDQERIESVEEIVDHISHGFDLFGSHLVQIAPDCGLRLLSPHSAFMKLKRLDEAIKVAYHE